VSHTTTIKPVTSSEVLSGIDVFIKGKKTSIWVRLPDDRSDYYLQQGLA